MEDSKEKIIKLFFENVYGKTPTINNYNSNHAGAKGHWLEIQLGKSLTQAMMQTFGVGNVNHTTSGKTTYGDWTANEYIFDRNNKYGIDRNDFLKFWGKRIKKKITDCLGQVSMFLRMQIIKIQFTGKQCLLIKT